MKKVKVLVPLIAALALLASCGGTSSSAESSSGTSSETPVESSVIDGSSDTGESTGGESTGGESSEEPSSTAPSVELTQDQIDALASGYAIDISVDDTPYGSLALNATGATIGYGDYGTYYYVPEEVMDQATGTSETYVAEAWLNLANEVETEATEYTWASMWTNVWSLLSVDDFSKLNTGVYQVYLDDLENATAVENYAIIQLGLQTIPDVSDITVTTDGESITSIDVAAADGTVITDTVTAVGDAVETSIAPATGDSISAIDDMIGALDNMDYQMTEEYAFLDEETGEYVVDSDYTYSIYVDGGVYAYDGDGYIQLTSGVEYVTIPTNSTYWYVGTIFYGYTLAELLYLIDDWQISSVLFEETETEGTYALRDDVPGLAADMGYYDAYMEGYTADDLTITVGTDSIVFTAMLDSETQYIVSYTGIGSTDISSVLGSSTSIYRRSLANYYNSIVGYASTYDFTAVLGTDDQDLWYYAFYYVYLPLYGLGTVSFFDASNDPFTDSDDITDNSRTVSPMYDIYTYSWFEMYLYMHGYSRETVTLDGYTYYVYTYEFSYTPTDEDGNAGTTETHTVSVYRNGYYLPSTAYFSSGYGYIYDVKIDLNLTAYTSAD